MGKQIENKEIINMDIRKNNNNINNSISISKFTFN